MIFVQHTHTECAKDRLQIKSCAPSDSLFPFIHLLLRVRQANGSVIASKSLCATSIQLLIEHCVLQVCSDTFCPFPLILQGIEVLIHRRHPVNMLR